MPEFRSPPAARSARSVARTMKRETACMEAIVAFALVLSICALLYVLSFDTVVGARAAIGFA